MKLTMKRALRQVQLMEYGFGPDVMERTKVCPACGRGNPSQRGTCTDCGAALGSETLLDVYRSRHPCCPQCGLAAPHWAVYCPDCGTRLDRRKAVT